MREMFCWVDNMDYMSEKEIPKTLVPVLPKKFFYLADREPPKDVPHAFFFNIDQDLVYEGFFEDFGPLNIAKIWKYVNEVAKFIKDQKFSTSIFYHYTSPHYTKASNSALLVCSYLIIMEDYTAQQAYKPFEGVPFRPFRDAGYGQCSYKCTVLECLKGLHYAIKLGWFDYRKFDITQYEHYQKPDNGDLNWIIPDKFIALSSPYDSNHRQNSCDNFTPKDYIPIFNKFGVGAVVRLNNQTYDTTPFKDAGITHHDLYFTDGTCPNRNIVEKFLSLAEKETKAIAVHCKAGLGRTGTLIGCYAIKHYRFNAADFIGWIRLCRPGSVLGPQQFFLIDSQQWLHEEGKRSPIWKQIKLKLSENQLSKQVKSLTLGKGKMSQEQKQIGLRGEHLQGNRLVQAKKKNKR